MPNPRFGYLQTLSLQNVFFLYLAIPPDKMEVICLEDKAFYALIDKVVVHIKEQNKLPTENKWISPDDALKMLNVTHKATLQRLRDAGKIGFTQPNKKIILYDRYSIIEYLENNSRDTF